MYVHELLAWKDAVLADEAIQSSIHRDFRDKVKKMCSPFKSYSDAHGHCDDLVEGIIKDCSLLIDIVTKLMKVSKQRGGPADTSPPPATIRDVFTAIRDIIVTNRFETQDGNVEHWVKMLRSEVHLTEQERADWTASMDRQIKKYNAMVDQQASVNRQEFWQARSLAFESEEDQEDVEDNLQEKTEKTEKSDDLQETDDLVEERAPEERYTIYTHIREEYGREEPELPELHNKRSVSELVRENEGLRLQVDRLWDFINGFRMLSK